MLRYLDVPIGGSLASCPRCGSADAPAIASTGEAVAGIREALSTGSRCIALVGADSFARDDWRDLVAAARSEGPLHLRIDAGSAMTASADTPDEIVAAGVRHVRVGMAAADGPGSAVLTAVRGIRDAAACRSVSVAVSVVVPVCRHNLHELPSLVTMLAEAGVASATLRLEDGSMPLGPAAPWLIAAADSGIVHMLWVRFEKVPPEAMPGYEIHLTEPFPLGVGR